MYLKYTLDYELHYTKYPNVLERYGDANKISNTKDIKSISGCVFTVSVAFTFFFYDEDEPELKCPTTRQLHALIIEYKTVTSIQTSIHFAVTLDCMWSLRNQVIHQDHQINILTTIKTLESKIVEHIHS
jgi:hypothetical protein